MDLSLLKDLSVIFGLSLCVAYICYRIRIPVIVGFLLTGILVGPHGLQLISAVQQVEVMSEAGIVLLLFTIGLELSIKELLQLKKAVFLGGTVQIILTIAAFAGISRILGFPPNIAIFIGFILSLSSTAIVLKILQERASMDSPAGRITLGIMIFQDLSIVPMMLLIPVLSGIHPTTGFGHNFYDLLRTFGLKFGLFILLIAAARFFIPKILSVIARTRSREIFLLATFAICLSIALATAHIGLSLALGAFLAGLFIAESQYSLSALENILPFKDLFTSLFFISVGMLLDGAFFIANLPMVLGIALVIIVVKSIMGALSAATLRYPLRPIILVGMGLAQVGEFSLVLAKEGLSEKLLTANNYQLFLSASILTMTVTPFWMALSPYAAQWLARISRKKRNEHCAASIEQDGQPSRPQPEETEEDAHVKSAPLKNHLIIVGFGIGGKHLARAATVAHIPYTVIEMNPDTVRKYSKMGIPIVYGDASNRATLEHVGIHAARVMSIVISDPMAIRRVTDAARTMNPSIYIIARTRFMREINDLRKLGADAVIVEEFEASTEVFHRVLSHYLIPMEDIQRFTTEIRAEGYDMLRSLDTESNPFLSIQENITSVQISTVTVERKSPIERKTLIESRLRHEYKVSVVAIRREKKIFANPEPHMRFFAGDAVYLFGEHQDILNAVKLFKADEGKTPHEKCVGS